MSRLAALLVAVAPFAVTFPAVPSVTAEEPGAPVDEQPDERTRIVLESDCHTETSRRRLTLFANGTMRLFDGLGATRTMRLVELGPDEMTAYVARFSGIEFDDLAPQLRGLEGDLVESCTLELGLPGEPVRRFDWEQFDTLPLGLRHVLLVVDDLLIEFESVREATRRPRGYEPELGDVLVRRIDGARFEVRGFSVEGTGIELEGIDQPVSVFILLDSLLDEFDPADAAAGPGGPSGGGPSGAGPAGR